MPVSGDECEVMGWELFYDLAKRVAQKVQASGYRPDLVVGLTPGGWILARVLCDLLDLKNMVSLKVEHWGATSTIDGKARLEYPSPVDLSGRRVLVVDDIADSGESMRPAMEYVRTLKPEEMRTAALRHIEGSEFVPDFYGDEITRRRVIFPWSLTENLCNIVPRVADECANIDEIRARLKRDYGIDVDEQRLSWILNELDRRSRG